MALRSFIPPQSTKRISRRLETIPYETDITFCANERLKKCQIGHCNDIKRERVFIFVGESGVGKTMLLNFIANYVLGVNYYDDFRYQLHHSENQSRWITSYNIKSPTRGTAMHPITLLDIPGFEGLDREDYILNEQIRTYFTNKTGNRIQHIDVVAFVMKASTTRINKVRKNVFDCVLKLFGKDISENIFLFFTHANQHKRPGVLDAVNEAQIPYMGWYKFDNYLLFKNSSDVDEIDPEEFSFVQKMNWNMGFRSLDRCFQDLNGVSPKSLTWTTISLDERHSLAINTEEMFKAFECRVRARYKLQEYIKVVEDLERKLKTYKADMFENISLNKKIKKMENGERAMVCTTCKWTCHSPCSHIINPFFTTCSSMHWVSMLGGCKTCPGRCAVGNHAKKDFMYINLTESNEIPGHDIEKLYDEAIENMEKNKARKRDIDKQMSTTQDELDKRVEKIRGSLDRLNQFALQSDCENVLNYLEDLRKKEIANRENGWENKENELKILIENEKSRGNACNAFI